jgi:hypothetical protein
MQEFYASIKLKNGDEMLTIVTKTCPEEDYITIKDPLGIEEIDIPGVIQGMKIKSWMKVSHQNEFILNGEDILAFKEVDMEVIAFYHHSLAKLEQNEIKKSSKRRRPPTSKKKDGHVPLDRDLGLLSDLDDAIELLEHLWNSESYSKDNKE